MIPLSSIIAGEPKRVSTLQIAALNRLLDFLLSVQDKVMRVDNVWAFCRDMQQLNPEAAWRVLDMSTTSSEQWI